jgi:hypothetical protein
LSQSVHPARDLPDLWTVVAGQYAELHKIARRLTEKPLPPDTTSPGDPAAQASDDPVHLVRALLDPWRREIRQLLRMIAGMRSTGTTLQNMPLDRSVHEARNAELACDSRAAALLAERADLREVLAALDQQLAAIFAARLTQRTAPY